MAGERTLKKSRLRVSSVVLPGLPAPWSACTVRAPFPSASPQAGPLPCCLKHWNCAVWHVSLRQCSVQPVCMKPAQLSLKISVFTSPACVWFFNFSQSCVTGWAGKRMVQGDWTECPACRCPANRLAFGTLLAMQSQCPLCGAEVSAADLQSAHDVAQLDEWVQGLRIHARLQSVPCGTLN